MISCVSCVQDRRWEGRFLRIYVCTCLNFYSDSQLNPQARSYSSGSISLAYYELCPLTCTARLKFRNMRVVRGDGELFRIQNEVVPCIRTHTEHIDIKLYRKPRLKWLRRLRSRTVPPQNFIRFVAFCCIRFAVKLKYIQNKCCSNTVLSCK